MCTNDIRIKRQNQIEKNTCFKLKGKLHDSQGFYLALITSFINSSFFFLLYSKVGNYELKAAKISSGINRQQISAMIFFCECFFSRMKNALWNDRCVNDHIFLHGWRKVIVQRYSHSMNKIQINWLVIFLIVDRSTDKIEK